MISIGHSGKQRIQVVRAGEVIQDTGLIPNLLLDGFFNRLTDPNGVVFTALGSNNRCLVGSGSTPPTNTDTALEAFVGSHDSSVGTSTFVGTSGGFGVYAYTRVFTFPIGAVVGNLSEIGTIIDRASNDDLTPLDTRALIVDTDGNLLTLPVTAQDQLIITHVRNTMVPDAAATGTITDNNNNDYTYEIKRTYFR